MKAAANDREIMSRVLVKVQDINAGLMYQREFTARDADAAVNAAWRTLGHDEAHRFTIVSVKLL